MKFHLIICSIILCATLYPLCIHAQQANNNLKKAYRFYTSITVDGRQRTYLLNLPPDYYDSSGFALVIAMHGGGGNAYQFERTSLLTNKANEAKFIVVYPEGVKNKVLNIHTWNAGSCCAYAAEHDVDDVKFISNLIDTLLRNYKINYRKVYSSSAKCSSISANVFNFAASISKFITFMQH